MKLFKIPFAALIAYVPTAWSAVDYNIKYSSNYLMPACVRILKAGLKLAHENGEDRRFQRLSR